MNRHALLWTVAAALGIVLAAALTWSASQIAAQRIGLASEPLSVQNGLAPDAATPPAPRHARAHGVKPRPPRIVAPQAPAAPAAAPCTSTATAPLAPAATSSTPATAGAAPPLPPATTPTVAHAATAPAQQPPAHIGGGNDGSGDLSGGGAGSHRDD